MTGGITMSVERNKDGSITIKHNNSLIAIGKIESVSVTKQEEQFQNWVEYWAKRVTPCARTLVETEQYFLKLCNALPLEPGDTRMRGFGYSVIMNHFQDRLEHQAASFSFDMSDIEIENWHKNQQAMQKEVINSTPERFGIEPRGYYLPRNEGNAVFYEEALREQEQMDLRFKQRGLRPFFEVPLEDICFFFEKVTGDYQCSGGARVLMHQLTVFRGVAEEDIVKRTPRFLGYICALRDLGEIPDFQNNV
jgi:hypothetical protein